MIAGTATHVSNNVSRRQARRWSEQSEPQQPQYAEAPVQQNTNDVNAQMEELKQLGQLKDQGILTQEEFDAKKKQILGL